jgi:hypothetical protein
MGPGERRTNPEASQRCPDELRFGLILRCGDGDQQTIVPAHPSLEPGGGRSGWSSRHDPAEDEGEHPDHGHCDDRPEQERVRTPRAHPTRVRYFSSLRQPGAAVQVRGVPPRTKLILRKVAILKIEMGDASGAVHQNKRRLGSSRPRSAS